MGILDIPYNPSKVAITGGTVLGGGSVNLSAGAAVSGTGWNQTITTQIQNVMSMPATDFVFSAGPGTNDIYINSSPQTAAALIPLATRYFEAVQVAN